MTKKKAAAKRNIDPKTVADLNGDPANPREMSDRASWGLRNSLAEFGDIAGITFNRRTGELVTGHQRVGQIKKRWGELAIQTTNDPDKGVIRTPDGHAFAVRYVDWSKARQRAANVAANSHVISGDYTDELNAYLLEVQSELEQESPNIIDDLLLADLCAIETISKQTTAEVGKQIVDEVFQVIIECTDENMQHAVFDEQIAMGRHVKLLTI